MNLDPGVAVAAARTGDGVSASLAAWSVVHEGQLEAPAITKSDEQFMKENLEFVVGQQDLNLTELNDLFELVRAPCKQSTAAQCRIGSSQTSCRGSKCGKAGLAGWMAYTRMVTLRD